MHANPAILAVLALALGAMQQAAPSPPAQPPDGPGGSAYPYARVVMTRLGNGNSEVYLFEPAEPTPRSAPVVVFTHGWAGMDPNYYGAWLTHIVRRGFTVVFPRYQADVRTPVAEFTGNALNATVSALQALSAAGHVSPDPRGVIYVGHSMGGLIAANLAARASLGSLPRPLALMSVEPGKTWPANTPIAFSLDDLSVLPANLLLLTIAGDDDDFVRDVDAKQIYRGATQIGSGNKNYIEMRSDDHGSPVLLCDHRAATAPGIIVPGGATDFDGGTRGPMVTDALDYYGTWKLLDGLADTVFRGIHREYALGDTAEQRDMGRWSDGVPVRQLIVREQ